MARIVFNGAPGDVWTNDTGTVQYQLIVDWINSCGLCCQNDHAIGPSWPIPFHRGCLLPGTEIIAPGIVAGMTAQYSGPIRRVTFDDGVTVAITANHMLLTPTGFAAAKSLMDGDDVIGCTFIERAGLGDADDDGKPARIEEVIESLCKSAGARLSSEGVLLEDLHGDGRFCHGNIDVVTTNSLLQDESKASGLQMGSQFPLQGTYLSLPSLAAQRNLDAVLLALRDATDGGVGSVRERKAFLWGQLRQPKRLRLSDAANVQLSLPQESIDRHSMYAGLPTDFLLAHSALVQSDNFFLVKRGRSEPQPLSFAASSELDPLLSESSHDGLLGDAKRLRDATNRFPSLIATRKIAKIETTHYSGPVYDVQTTSSLYVFANGAASSNCRCKQVLIAPGRQSQPFVDFRAIIDTLDPVQQSRVVGRSNLTLIEQGVVKWEDVVTRTRVRDFREVVARADLSVKEMIKAGVNPRLAAEAFATVHTPAHQLAAAQRQNLLGQLAAKGVSKAQVRQALAERLAARVGIGQGPSGPSPNPIVPGTPSPKPPPVVPPVLPSRAKRKPVPLPIPIPAIAGGSPEAVQRVYLRSLGVSDEAIERVQPETFQEKMAKRAEVEIARLRASDEPSALIAKQLDRFARWKDEAKVNPELIPPLPVKERLRIYAERAGNAKVKAIVDATAKSEELEARFASLEKAATATKEVLLSLPANSPDLKKAAAELQRINKEWDAINLEPASKIRAQAVKAVKADKPLEYKVNYNNHALMGGEPVDDASRRAVETGVAFVAQLMTQIGPHPLQVPVACLKGDGGRSHCSRDGLMLDRSDGATVVVHELGHWLDNNTGSGKSSKEFLAYRVGDEPLRPMREVSPGRYGLDELGRKDRFDEVFTEIQAYYTGKDYAPEHVSEVTAMGLQALFDDPAKFARKAPEFCMFILGILDGSLR